MAAAADVLPVNWLTETGPAGPAGAARPIGGSNVGAFCRTGWATLSDVEDAAARVTAGDGGTVGANTATDSETACGISADRGVTGRIGVTIDIGLEGTPLTAPGDAGISAGTGDVDPDASGSADAATGGTADACGTVCAIMRAICAPKPPSLGRSDPSADTGVTVPDARLPAAPTGRPRATTLPAPDGTKDDSSASCGADPAFAVTGRSLTPGRTGEGV